MQTLASIKERVRLILGDAAGDRFGEDLLDCAIRQALTRVDERLPLVRMSELVISTPGRDQTLEGLDNPLYLVKVMRLAGADGIEEEIRGGYTYTLNGSTGNLHFGGVDFPAVGEMMQITYAAANTLSGLEDVETTSLPESAASALEMLAAGMACLLRAAAVAESYGARAGESARMVEQSRLWMELANQNLEKLTSLQEFAFPAGFALDEWDQEGG